MTPPPDRETPGPGRESVWDYPRPPRLEDVSGRVTVEFNGEVVADTTRAKRVLETSHPPTVYVPPEDVRREFLRPTGRTSACEWKGRATYADVTVGDSTAREAAWSYPDPVPAFSGLKEYVSFYPGRVGRCTIDGEAVEPQPGDFYGGWKTSKIVGPVKGGPGTRGW